MKINTFDIDGVIYFGDEITGVRPCNNDIIITGRSYQQSLETKKMLESRGIYNEVFFNPLQRNLKNVSITGGIKKNKLYSRKSSGIWKANAIQFLKNLGYEINMHFEDDIVQIKEIKKVHKNLNIIHMVRENEQLIKY